MAVAHLAVEFSLGNQRRDRVHYQNIDCARADQGFGDFERLFTVVGLGDQQVIHVHAQFFGVTRIKSVLGIDEGGHAAGLLSLRNDL